MLINSMRLQFIPYEIFEPDQQHIILHFDQKTKLGPKSSRSLMTSGLNCNPDLHPKCLLPQALLGSQTTLLTFSEEDFTCRQHLRDDDSIKPN